MSKNTISHFEFPTNGLSNFLFKVSCSQGGESCLMNTFVQSIVYPYIKEYYGISTHDFNKKKVSRKGKIKLYISKHFKQSYVVIFFYYR